MIRLKYLLIYFFIFAAPGIYAQAPVTCPFAAGPDTAVCAGNAVQLYSTPGFSSYDWSPGTGLSDSTIANPFATVTDAISYTVTATQGSSTGGPNLILNGDFSLGNIGFTCGQTFTSMYSPGNYFVGPTFFNTAYSQGDHTPTTDEMLMSVDGGSSLVTLWQQALTGLSPSTNYTFSFWCTDNSVNAPQFEIHFIGNVTGDNIIATLPGILGAPPPASYWLWSQYSIPSWNSGPNTSMTIRVVNTELNGYGNDFALDDFVFQTTSSSVCAGTDTVNLTVNPPPQPPVMQNTTYCQNDATLQLQATGSNILWYATPGSYFAYTAAPTPSSVSAGQSYYYATQTVNGCESDTAMASVNVLAGAPVFALDPAPPPCPQTTKLLGPSDTTWQYMWMDGLTTSPRLLNQTGNYLLTASNSCGSFTDSVSFIIEDCDCYFYLPNAFTPNLNGINDEFRAVHDCIFETYRMMVFNRWGEKLFDTSDPQKGWDGTYHGKMVEQGVYVVHVDYSGRDQNGYFNPKSILGTVTVVK